MIVYLVVSLPRIPYVHCIYMVLANPTLLLRGYLFRVKNKNGICRIILLAAFHLSSAAAATAKRCVT
jgi:hypothetical protein